MNLDTLSSDSSEEELRDSGRSFESLIVWGNHILVGMAGFLGKLNLGFQSDTQPTDLLHIKDSNIYFDGFFI